MSSVYVMTGTLVGPKQVELDESLPIEMTKVRLVVEPIEESSTNSYQQVMAQIRERQDVRGHQVPSRNEVDRYLADERSGWV